MTKSEPLNSANPDTSGYEGLHCVGVELNTRDPEKLARFYIDAMSFTLSNDATDTVELSLEQCLLRLRRVQGRAIPTDSRSHDRWFRHLAIVVRDVAAAVDHVKTFIPQPISSEPQTLPSWNPDSAGIEAYYLRDPEGHPLELIHFPQGKGRPQWQTPGPQLYQGVDHTAIVVSSAAASIEFYRSLAQLAPTAVAHNYGVEQERLSQLKGASLHATSLGNAATQAPSLELLEYALPGDGRAMPADTSREDVWSSATIFEGGDIHAMAPPEGGWVDPDGYRAVLR